MLDSASELISGNGSTRSVAQVDVHSESHIFDPMAWRKLAGTTVWTTQEALRSPKRARQCLAARWLRPCGKPIPGDIKAAAASSNRWPFSGGGLQSER